MKINSSSIPPKSLDSEQINKPPVAKYLGMVTHLQDAFPSKTVPCHTHGALQGEGVMATYDQGRDDNCLYSLNAQTCVIATLYNPATQTGAVIHVDHNLSELIDTVIAKAVEGLGRGSIISTLAGGVWFMGGEDIGKPIKNSLLRHAITPSWDHWSFSPCIEHNYGVVLDLKNGNVNVFEHSIPLVAEFHDPLFNEAVHNPGSPHLQRANDFMTRFKQPPVLEHNNRAQFQNGTGATAEDLAKHQIKLHTLYQ